MDIQNSKAKKNALQNYKATKDSDPFNRLCAGVRRLALPANEGAEMKACSGPASAPRAPRQPSAGSPTQAAASPPRRFFSFLCAWAYVWNRSACPCLCDTEEDWKNERIIDNYYKRPDL